MSTRTYIGNSVATKDVWTVTVANTWATADTGTLTINGKDLVVTIGSLTTTAQVATSLKEAWESASFTDTTASCIPQGGGTTIGEMSELTATVSGSTVILTADTAGVPHTISVSEVTAGTGTLSIAHTVTATGPAYYGNVDNWLEGAAATTGDDMIWNSPVSIKYDLAQSAITLASLTIGPMVTTTYRIGLPATNTTNSSYPYAEYRATELAISATVITCNGAPGLMKINLGTAQAAVTINSSGTTVETGRPAIQIRGTHISNTLNLYGGDVGWGSNNETATVVTVTQDGGTFTAGTAVTLTTLAKQAGTATINCAATTISSLSGSLTQSNAAVTTVNANGGTVTLSGTGNLTTVNMLAGTLTVASTRGTITTLTKTAGTAYIYTTVTTGTNTAGDLTMTTGGMTTLNNTGTFQHSGSVTISTLNQYGGTVTLTHASSVVTLLNKVAGNAYLAGSCTTSTNTAGTLVIGAGNVTALTSYSGKVSYLGTATITAATLYGGSLDLLTGDITLLTVYDGTAVVSRAGTLVTLRQTAGTVKVLASATALTTIDKSGGTCECFVAVTTATNEGGNLTLWTGNSTTITGVNGYIRYNGAGTLTTVTLSNATTFDVDGGTAAMTITNLSRTDNVTFRHATGRVTLTNPSLPTGIIKLSPI